MSAPGPQPRPFSFLQGDVMVGGATGLDVIPEHDPRTPKALVIAVIPPIPDAQPFRLMVPLNEEAARNLAAMLSRPTIQTYSHLPGNGGPPTPPT